MQNLDASHNSPVVTEDLLLSKCRFFADVHLWPRLAKLDPQIWLSNFTLENERGFALHLLSAFLYISDELTDRLFVSAFQALSRHVVSSKESFLTARDEWRRFVNSVIVVGVTGELPSDTDSGFIFLRKARDLLLLPEQRVMSAERALQRIIVDPFAPVVFVDDFVGSGNQFAELWTRDYPVGKHGTASFSAVANAHRPRPFFYCPLICTESGKKNLEVKCPQVAVWPAHILSDQHNALHPKSVIWPEQSRAASVSFIKACSERAGIPDRQGGVGDWRGFHAMGLALAFEHGTPDATLPIFTFSSPTWKPLLRK